MREILWGVFCEYNLSCIFCPSHCHTISYVDCTIMALFCISHWGRVTHICISNLTIIGSDNGLSPGRRQAIIWTNAVILWIRPFGTNFSEILIEFLTFWFKKMHLNVSSAKWRPFCVGLNVIPLLSYVDPTYMSGLDNPLCVIYHLAACQIYSNEVTHLRIS